jgi:hypothetical protein
VLRQVQETDSAPPALVHGGYGVVRVSDNRHGRASASTWNRCQLRPHATSHRWRRLGGVLCRRGPCRWCEAGRSDPLSTSWLSPRGRSRPPATAVGSVFRRRPSRLTLHLQNVKRIRRHERALKRPSHARLCGLLRPCQGSTLARRPCGVTALTRPKQAVNLLLCDGRSIMCLG